MKRTNGDQNKGREERESRIWRERAGKATTKNGKCCTNSDIKLIFFIMHQASCSRALILCRNRFWLSVRCFIFAIFIQITLFFTVLCRLILVFKPVTRTSARKKQKQIEIDNSVNDASYFRHMHRHGRQGRQANPIYRYKGH